MLPSNEEFKFFYNCLISDKLGFEDSKRVIMLCLKYPIFSRFASALNIDSSVITEDYKVFNDLKKQITFSYLKQKSFLTRLANLISNTNDKIILLKSTAFNGYLYSGIGIRGNSDIDLLIDRQDSGAFEVSLSQIAYKAKSNNTSPFADIYESTWISALDENLYIDVHRSLANPLVFPLGNRKTFDHTQMHPGFESPSIVQFIPEISVLHMAMHIFNDGYYKHHSLIDAALIIKKYDVKQNKVLKYAKDFQARRVVNFLFYLVRKIIDNVEKTSVIDSPRFWLALRVMKYKYGKKTLKRRFQQISLMILLIERKENLFKLLYIYFLGKLDRMIKFIRNSSSK